MPYIKQSLRGPLDEFIDPLCKKILYAELSDAPGIMNYIISRIASVEIRQNPRYITINEAIGVLECAKLELYRRLAADYEDQKCKQNGDVFDADTHKE